MDVVWIKGPDDKYWAAGLEWRTAEDAKEAKNLAREAAVALAEKKTSGPENVCVAGHVVLTSKESRGSVYGIGCIEQKTLKDKAFKKHYAAVSLAAAAASHLEDGIYLFAIKGSEEKQLFWLLGISSNMVIPQTDLVFEDPQEAASNCAMLRALMTSLAFYVDPESGLAVSMDQKEFSWSDVKFDTKAAKLSFSTAKTQPSKSAAVAKAVVAVLFLAGLGGGGWYYYESTKPKPLTPEQVAMQRRQSYENEVTTIAQQYAPALLQWRWEQVKKIDLIARTSQGSGLVPLALDCTENTCSLRMALAEDFLYLAKPIEGRLKKGGYEFTSSNEGGKNWTFAITLQPPENVVQAMSAEALRQGLLRNGAHAKLVEMMATSPSREILAHTRLLETQTRSVAQTNTAVEGEPVVAVESAGVEFSTPAGTRFVDEFLKSSMAKAGPVKIKYGENGEISAIETDLLWVLAR